MPTHPDELLVDEAIPLLHADPIHQRRAAIEEKQATIARILADLECEGIVLFMPAHVAWFCSGFNARGLLADTERPGIYTNGKQRWLLCSNADSQRLFDEELDRLGFQLKEWHWTGGRAALLGELVVGKKIAADRPFPGLKVANERLRPELRPLAAYDRERYLALGKIVTHAVEATARNVVRGDTEEEVAGQVAHRLYHHGVEAVGVSVTADDRGKKFRRAGFTSARIELACVIQATGARDGLFVTASRSLAFGAAEAFRQDHDWACRVNAVCRSLGLPGKTIGAASETARRVSHGTEYEFEWRESQPGYGAGWFIAEELRRAGVDEPLVANQGIVWQTRIGAAAVVDTMLVAEDGPIAVTPPEDWPFKRIKLSDRAFDVPDVLVRS